MLLSRLRRRLTPSIARLPASVIDRLLPGPVVVDGKRLDRRVQWMCWLAERAYQMPGSGDLRALRTDYDVLGRELGPSVPDGLLIQDRVLDGPDGPLPVRIFAPAGPSVNPRPGLVFFHGGGWSLGSVESHHGVCAAVASHAGAVVVSVDYRLAPEHPFPAAFDDAVAAFRQVASDATGLGIDAQRLAVGGDSAGGTLALHVSCATREDEVRPCLQWLLYPAADFSRAYPSKARFGHGYFLDHSRVDWFMDHLLNSRDELLDPRLSPVLGDLARLPATRLVIAGFDLLQDEDVALGKALRDAGVSVSVARYDDMTHAFIHMTRVAPRAARAFARELGNLKRTLGERPDRTPRRPKRR